MVGSTYAELSRDVLDGIVSNHGTTLEELSGAAPILMVFLHLNVLRS